MVVSSFLRPTLTQNPECFQGRLPLASLFLYIEEHARQAKATSSEKSKSEARYSKRKKIIEHVSLNAPVFKQIIFRILVFRKKYWCVQNAPNPQIMNCPKCKRPCTMTLGNRLVRNSSENGAVETAALSMA